MDALIVEPAVGLLLLAAFFAILYWVVRAAVGAAIRGSLRHDLLSPSADEALRSESDTSV